MKLGMWPRLGIVLTALWLAGGTYHYATTEQRDWIERSEDMHLRCMTSSDGPAAMQKCQADNAASMERLRDANVWQNSFWFSLMLAVLVWIVVGTGYAATRWVLAGRTKP